MNSKGLLVYLAGKYNAKTDGERLRNTDKIIDIGIEIYERSNHLLYPHIPHLTHYIEKRMDYLGYKERPNEYWYEFDNIILPKCDILYKISKDGESKGADMEEQLAIKEKIPVVKSMEELFNRVEEIQEFVSK